MTIFKKKISDHSVEQFVNYITFNIRPSDALIRIDEKANEVEQVVTIKNSTNGRFVRIVKKINDAICELHLCEDNPKTAANITRPFNTQLVLYFNRVPQTFRHADQSMIFLLEGAITSKVHYPPIPATCDRDKELDIDTVFYGIITDFSITYKAEYASAILKLEGGGVIMLEGEQTDSLSVIRKGSIYVENKEGDSLVMSVAKFNKRFTTMDHVPITV